MMAPLVWEVGEWVGTLPRDEYVAAVERAYRWACWAARVEQDGEGWSDLVTACGAVLDYQEALAAAAEGRL
jgi:hypothetical protein